jgi:protein-S-isoprenylcysteine O-methyltransferase Ste14
VADEEEKATTRWVPMPPTYVWAAIVLMVALHFVCPGIKRLVPWPYNWIGGAVVIVAGIALAWVPELQFRKVGTEIKPFRDSSHLVTTGLYRISRHPMYLGMALVLVGVFVVLNSLVPAIVIPAFVVVITIRFIIPEERDMARQFGEQYLAYKRKVRRWI